MHLCTIIYKLKPFAMYTFIFSAVGIISLVIISFVFSSLSEWRNRKGSDQLAAFRNKFAINHPIVKRSREISQQRILTSGRSIQPIGIFPGANETPRY